MEHPNESPAAGLSTDALNNVGNVAASVDESAALVQTPPSRVGLAAMD
jgi:hypothetical protein